MSLSHSCSLQPKPYVSTSPHGGEAVCPQAGIYLTQKKYSVRVLGRYLFFSVNHSHHASSLEEGYKRFRQSSLANAKARTIFSIRVLQITAPTLTDSPNLGHC